MNQNHARDSCSVALVVHDRLLAALQGRIQSRAERYADLGINLLGVARTSSLLKRACSCGYHGAAKRLTRRVDRLAEDLRRELDGLPTPHDAQEDIPTPGQLAGELRQIEDEFGKWKYQSRERVLSVTTGPIQLEDVYLGPFSIELELDPLAHFAGQPGGTGQHPFKVIALDPQPAAGSSHVTHPHVSDERLCTGESAHSVSSALMDGRLADFFLIVRGLLQTYNLDSPYVSLDVWTGTSCHECGDRVHEDDRSWCDECEHDVCDGCMSSCDECGDSSCYGCLTTCKHCEEYHCDGCMKTCSECGKSCCIGCMEDEMCPPCLEDKENQDEPEDDQEPKTTQETPTETTPKEPASA